MSQNVTLALARTMIEAARKRAEEIGVPMCIAVVDDGPTHNLSGRGNHPPWNCIADRPQPGVRGMPMNPLNPSVKEF
jgi:Haem-degrading